MKCNEDISTFKGLTPIGNQFNQRQENEHHWRKGGHRQSRQVKRPDQISKRVQAFLVKMLLYHASFDKAIVLRTPVLTSLQHMASCS